MYEVKDNFLSPDEFEELQKTIFHYSFAWFYRNTQVSIGVNDENPTDFWFSHVFYEELQPCSPYYDTHIKPIFNKLGACAVSNARANMLVNRGERIESPKHYDYRYEGKGKTAILYLNTCNGYTVLDTGEKEIKVDSKENRLLVFDSLLEHKAVSQTDTPQRVVINFNYVVGGQY